MKAERRHQLQDNELVKQLETLPEKLQRNASKIVLAITFFLLVFFILRYRNQAAIQRQNALAGATTTAQLGPRQLRSLDGQFIPPEQLASYRTQITSEVNGAIDTILREAEGDEGAALRADALIAKGDLNWTLANLTPLPGAATQQALRPARTTEEYLKAAETAYRDVVNAYSNHMLAWVGAQFGLAAIAENRGDWQAARDAYSTIINRKDVPIGFQQQAQGKLLILSEIQGPVLLGAYPATAPSTAPSAPSTTDSTIAPAVTTTGADFNSAARLPTTMPAAVPSTQP
jgi:hypothetical protein